MNTLRGPIEIADNIYWVGINDQKNNLHCNPYLIVDGEEGILIDPGSVLDFDFVYDNVKKIIPIENIKYIILNHQDPDLCSSVPLFEKKGFNGEIATHWRSSVIIKFYGVKSKFYLIDANEMMISFSSGRKLIFIPTPYLHFPGSVTTYDEKSKILFSSDLFGSFSRNGTLYADSDYVEGMKTFHEHYMPSNEILKIVMKKFMDMDIEIIAPQHGSIIKKDIKKYINELMNLECGVFLDPIKKDLLNDNGYSGIVNLALKRLKVMLSEDEMHEIFDDSGIKINYENAEIQDFSMTGEKLWDSFFEIIYSKKGIKLLIIIEKFVEKIVKSYDIEWPKIYSTISIENVKEIHRLKESNAILRKNIIELTNNINKIENEVLKCSITGFYNEKFFDEFLIEEINKVKLKNYALFYLDIDNIVEINRKYGKQTGDEILKIVSTILSDFKSENHVVFKRNAPGFIYYVYEEEREQSLDIAEKLRFAISQTEKTIEPITVSISMLHSVEIRDNQITGTERLNFIKKILIDRLQLSKLSGGNAVTFEADINVDVIREYAGKILIVDNDDMNVQILKTAFKGVNLKAISAKDGIEAYEIIEIEKPDLIISETMLPKMDGFILKEKLKENSEYDKIPFFIISSKKDEKSILRAHDIGIFSYFKKPYFVDEILGIAKKAISEGK